MSKREVLRRSPLRVSSKGGCDSERRSGFLPIDKLGLFSGSYFQCWLACEQMFPKALLVWLLSAESPIPFEPTLTILTINHVLINRDNVT